MPVNLNISCTHCHKPYSVPEAMAGKRVKCKACGEVFVASRPTEASQSALDLAALESLEPAAYVPPPIAAPPPRSRASASPGFTGGMSLDSAPLMYAPPIVVKRRWRAPGPLDDLFHDKLPLVLILLGYVLPFIVSFIAATQSPSPGISLLNLVLDVAVLLGITLPITVAGLKVAAHVMKYELDPSPAYRILAAYGGTMLILSLYARFTGTSAVLVSGSLAQTIINVLFWLAGALVLSYLVTFTLIWLFFRLNFKEAVVTWAISSVANIIGGVAAIAVLIVIGLTWARLMPADQPRVASNSGTQSPPQNLYTPNPAPDSAAATPAPHSPVFGNMVVVIPESPAEIQLDQNRKTTQNFLQLIGTNIQHYADRNHQAFPPSLQIPGDKVMFNGNNLQSPFAASGTNGSYVYRYYAGLKYPGPHQVIIAYDPAERNADNQTTVLRASGDVETISNAYLDASLKNSDQTAGAEIARQTAAPIEPPAESTTPTSQPPPTPTQTQTVASIDPILPAHAWTAEPDPPAETEQINPRLRQIFAGDGTFFFPRQPSDFVLLSRQTTGRENEKPTDELWNLKTLVKVSQFPTFPSTAGVLSPDGKLFATRASGGQDKAASYDVYSTHTGKLVQTLSGPPMSGKNVPTPIGFVGDNQLVTLSDDLKVWDIKQGIGLRHFGDADKLAASSLIALSPTGKLLAVLASDGETLLMYSTANGKRLGQTPIPDRAARPSEPATALRALAFSPDGRELALLLGGRRIYNWSVADGSLTARFNLKSPIDSIVTNTDAPNDSMVWTPDSQGWLVGGDHIIDRMTGIIIYVAPPFHEQGAKEIGVRQMIDKGHLLLGFADNTGKREALETFVIDSKAIEKNQATMRALVTPMNAPATRPGE